MTRVIRSAFMAFLSLFMSCEIEPEKIDYGIDACSFCKMIIVDQQHAAQYVAKNAKQYKFDAIECMLNDIAEKGSTEISICLIADYMQPASMIRAQDATYLISDMIKSPMGANLSGFSDRTKAEVMKIEKGGQLYSWQELLIKFDAE
ncbi:nitrous oxide reductase accessory protein NosL [Lutimonas sp.]|uniref:nitrous oxide reductase accessory protein NosL n=1 Tax=Lutimonas sp. TaxID=1872403 RepID=UPI003C769888